MIVDHLCLITGTLDGVRLTLGRLAMPVFFVLAGHLARRLTYRHAVIGAVGLALPLVVPWIERPNVLVWYAAGAAVVVLSARAHRAAPAAVGLLAITFTANFPGTVGTGYAPTMLLALMVAGHYMPRSWLTRAGQDLPSWMAPIGRRPMTWYVGHLLVLQAVVLLVGLTP